MLCNFSTSASDANSCIPTHLLIKKWNLPFTAVWKCFAHIIHCFIYTDEDRGGNRKQSISY